LDVRKKEPIKQDNVIVGTRTRVKVVKNKVAPPFKEAEFDIMYGHGISREGIIVDLGTEMEVINKSGSWYSYKDKRVGQGRENVKKTMMEDPQLADEIESKIREILLADKTAAVDKKAVPAPSVEVADEELPE